MRIYELSQKILASTIHLKSQSYSFLGWKFARQILSFCLTWDCSSPCLLLTRRFSETNGMLSATCKRPQPKILSSTIQLDRVLFLAGDLPRQICFFCLTLDCWSDHAFFCRPGFLKPTVSSLLQAPDEFFLFSTIEYNMVLNFEAVMRI